MGTSSTSGHALSRRYSLIAAASIIPLFLIILLLAWFQFRSQHDQQMENLEGEVVKHASMVGHIINNVRDHVRSMAAWAAIYEAGPSLSAQALLDREPSPGEGVEARAPGPRLRWPPEDSRAFFKGEEARAAEIGAAAGLVQHMRLAHRAMPYLRWSYYFSSDRDFVSLYPFRRFESLGGALRTVPDEQVLDRMLAQPIIERDADGQATSGLPPSYWTPAFLDPAGAGWMVAHAVDAPLADGRRATVASAVLLDFLTGFIRAFDYPCGKTWLINDQGQVLAASDGRHVSGLRLLNVDDVAPAALSEIPIETIAAPSAHFRSFNGVEVLSRPIATTSWRLLYVVEPGEVTALILPRFIPYGVIVVGLLLTFFLAQGLRQRLIVGPALALVDYVQAESQERPQPAPALPAMWRPWVATISEAFVAKREANQRILESEAYFRTMAEAHPVPVVIVTMEDGRILHASKAFADLVRLPLVELIGSGASRLYAHPEGREQRVRRLREEGGVQTFGQWLMRGDGSTFEASISARPIEFKGIEAVISGVMDLTEKKAAEAKIEQQRTALEQSEQRFRTIAEGHPAPLVIVRSADQKILYASPPFAALLGVPLADLYNRDLGDFYAIADERQRIVEIVGERQRVDHVEVDVRRADGSVFTAALTSRPMNYEGDEALVSSLVDLTDKKRAEAEIRRQRDALHQSEKLNALGSLLANVAHELNNPLSLVVGYATMQLDLSTDPKSRERAERIHVAAERCARIVRTFLAMARQKQAVREPVHLNQVIDAALEIAGYGLRTADIDLELDLDADLPELWGDGDQLTLVFMNLIVNAQHALQDEPGPRRVRISTGAEGREVWAELADNGGGVDSEIVTRIFEPFFTTKPQGVGTGIGLSVCHTIAAAHEGEIRVASNLTGGALFRISLPIMDIPEEDEVAWKNGRQRTPKRRGRILVVEDEPEIAEMVADMLRQDGHEVWIALSGRAALDQIGDCRPDLVVSDLRMPGLGGPDLHRLLTERDPAVARRMLFMTGDTLAYGLSDFFERTGLPMLEKPLEPDVLRQKVQDFLSEEGTGERAGMGQGRGVMAGAGEDVPTSGS